MAIDGIGRTEVGRRLGYLFKHAHAEMERRNDAALAPHGVDSRELGILLGIARLGAPSQQQVSEHMGIDRTTMVARIDTLEAKGIVERHPDPADRRRNVVSLTDEGGRILTAATAASDAAEAGLLEPLAPEEAGALRELLARILAHPSSDQANAPR